MGLVGVLNAEVLFVIESLEGTSGADVDKVAAAVGKVTTGVLALALFASQGLGGDGIFLFN